MRLDPVQKRTKFVLEYCDSILMSCCQHRRKIAYSGYPNHVLAPEYCGYPCNFTLLCVLNQVNELYADLLFKMLIPTHAWLKLQNKCILLARSTRLPINRNLKSLGVSTLFFFYPASIFFSTQSCYDILHTASGFTR